MKWLVLNKFETQNSCLAGRQAKPETIFKTLLKTRKIENTDGFLNPPFPEFKLTNTTKAINRIKKAIKNQEKIIVYGDYDVDGICATAIMWETLNSLKADVLPFIPQREKDGYGLSKSGIDQVEASLIIVVDSGITANEAVEYANKKNTDVIILDHHERSEKLPEAFSIIHTTELCAAGIAYFFATVILGSEATPESDSGRSLRLCQNDSLLELACIATVADMMPLTGINRSIVKHGLKNLNETNRPGLKSLFEIAGIKNIGVYEIGYLIGPRINASGRIDSALTALRLLCTHKKDKANEWAKQLNDLNKERQSILEDSVKHTLSIVDISRKIIVVDSENYHQGIIGLIAGKLTEKYYLPSIAISRGEKISKASARSISGFNIIEAIRTQEQFLINAGGHPAAAGFTIETSKISNFKNEIFKYANEKISDDLLEKTLKIDLEIPLDFINFQLYELLTSFAPYGLGNPEPIFCSTGIVSNIKTLSDGKHLKLKIADFDAIGFNFGHFFPQLKIGQQISIAFNIDLNTYNGKSNLQLKIRDIKIPHGGTN